MNPPTLFFQTCVKAQNELPREDEEEARRATFPFNPCLLLFLSFLRPLSFFFFSFLDAGVKAEAVWGGGRKGGRKGGRGALKECNTLRETHPDCGHKTRTTPEHT